jgi:hypothetical protein
MGRRLYPTVFLTLLLLIFTLTVGKTQEKKMERMIGLYVHQHWPYHHPYAARTWTLQDWRGWADGLKRLGYNTILIWPMLETMPDPLTPSDRAYLTRLGKVVDMLHNDFQMRVYFALCPNIGANNETAAKYTFETRHYYYCDRLVNPADPVELDRLIRWREKLLKPLAKVDGISIIDSDPGCYPGSTNAEFVHLLVEHRKMLNRIRPEIELIYWMHAGWRGWSRFYETGKLLLGTEEEQMDTLTRLKEANPEPWGLANGLPYAQRLGIADKVISFNYGRIEGEPSFPMTNFSGQSAYEGGSQPGPRGVMGNAQTHCVQLPNIFAFARGATGQSLTEEDYVQFANDLLPGLGATIVEGWKTLHSQNPQAMRAVAARLEQAAAGRLKTGPLKGLLFGDPRRFLMDLVMMLRMRAGLEELVAAQESGQSVKAAFQAFVEAAEAWQKQHGYKNNWYDPRMHEALRKLNSPEINAALNVTYEAQEPFEPGVKTAAEQVSRNFARIETYTPRLLAAMRQALAQMR